MNRIDKLIIKARNAVRSGLELGVSFVERDGNSWAAIVHLHDGGHYPIIQRSTYDTMEAAVEHIHAVAEEYPNSQDVPVIIIDNLG